MLQKLEQKNNVDAADLYTYLYEENLLRQNNGQKFHFCYVVRLDEKGNPIFSEIGPEFKIIQTDNSKILVNASNETKVYLRDFETLGRPFYFNGYDPTYGGKDSVEGYCGWVLPVYNGNTYSLYDFDTFEPLLINCDIDEDYIWYGADLFWDPLYCFYLEAYDPIYGGHDVQDGGCGLVCRISKDDVYYLVDANDFSLILDSNFINHVYAYTDNDDGITRAVFNYCYQDEWGVDIEYTTRIADDIIPYKSDVLIKK